MAVSQKSIQERSLRLASAVGTDPAQNPVTDNAFLTEDLFRAAMREAVISERFERTFTLTMASGAALIPDSVIIEQLPTASIHPVDGPTNNLASFEERYLDFERAPYRQLAYFTVQGAHLLYRAAGAAASVYAGDVSLTAIAMPDIPSTITTALALPATVADRCVEILAP